LKAEIEYPGIFIHIPNEEDYYMTKDKRKIGLINLIVIVFVLFSSAVYSKDSRQISSRFAEILKPSVKYSEYIIKRDQFLALEGAEEFIKQKSEQKKDVTGRMLAYALLSMIRNKEQHEKLRVKISDNIEFLTQKRDSSRLMWHVRPDPTRKPMFPLFAIRKDAKNYIKNKQKHWEKYGSPFERWHTSSIKGPSLEKYIEGLQRSLWDPQTPCLTPIMCEIAIKGWHNTEETEALRQKGYGEDYYRYMAIHLLGELKYKNAAGYLLEILKDNKQDEYLRAHAARALIKIDASKYTEDFYQLVYIDRTSTKVIIREIQWDKFPKEAVVEVVTKLLPRADTFLTKNRLLIRLTDCFRKADADIQKNILSFLKDLRKDPDVRMRLRAKDILNWLSPPPRKPEDEKTKKARLKYTDTLERIRRKQNPLDFSNVFHGEQEYKLFLLMRGEIDREDAEELTSFYLGFVDYFAGVHGYTDANVFATKELHNYEWPANVIDYYARDFFMNMVKLKKGMKKEEIIEAAGPKLKEVARKKIPGTSLEYVKYKREFSSKVECNYGVKADTITIEMVFYKGKLRIVHDSRKR